MNWTSLFANFKTRSDYLIQSVHDKCWLLVFEIWVPSPLLMADMDLLKDERSHFSVFILVDATVDDGKAEPWLQCDRPN